MNLFGLFSLRSSKTSTTPPIRIKMRAMFVILAVFLCAGQVWGEDVTDELTQTLTGISGTSYSAWSGKTATSSAIYAGQSAGGNSSIQLRSNNSNSGVISTTSGGKVKSVTVVWNSNTANGRTINIYGKNAAYSAVTDLYNSSNQGTLLGTIVKETSTSLTINGDYEYIGIRSASGALYLDKISIVWASGSGSGEPVGSMTPDPASVDVTAEGEDNGSINITYSGITDMANVYDVKIYSDAEHTVDVTNTIDWLTAVWNTNKTAVEYVVEANTGAERTAYIYLYAHDDNENEVEKVISVTQAEYVAPFDGLKLTFDVSSNPGEWPTTNSNETTNYTYSLNEVDYTFALNNVKCNSGYLMLTSTAVLGLPAIEDYKLVKIEASNSGSCSTSTKVKVTTDAGGQTIVSGGVEQTWATTSSTYTYTLSGTEANTMYYLYISNKNCQITSLVLYYEEVAPSAVKKPIISGEDNFLNTTMVTIANQTEGAAVYYTTDGTAPTSSSTLYSAPFVLNATATVKAIAIKDANESDVAEMTFTKATALTTMQEIFDAATTEEVAQYITFNSAWVVTGISTNGKNAYITDGTKGMVLYNSSASTESPVGGLTIGSTLSGTVQRTLTLYNGAAELVGFTAEGLTVGSAEQPAVQELDAEGIAALTGVNTGSLIKISGQCTTSNNKYYIGDVQLYHTLFEYTAPTVNANYTWTGVYTQFNTTKEILPRSAEDLVKEDEKQEANTYWDGAASASLTIRANESVTALWSTVSTGDKHFTSSEESVAIIAADGTITIQGVGTTVLTYTTDANATYLEGSATLTLTVKAALLAGATEFTWDATAQSYTNEQVLETVTTSPNPIITFAKGGQNDNKWYDNGSAARFYKDNTLTITAPEGKLLYQIEINFTSGNAKTLTPDVASYSLDGTLGSWAGLVNEVVFTNNDAVARISSITVIYGDGTITSLSIADVAMKLTDEPKTIVVDKNVETVVNYVVDDETVATIADGKITPVAVGSTTVTATIAQGANYTAAQTTFTITVADKDVPALSFDEETYVATMGSDFTAPTLNNAENVTVTYSSSNTEVATVDANTGAITLVAAGETTITASFAGNDDYAANSASYTLTVNPAPVVLTDYYEKVTSTAGITEGTYLIVYEEGSVAFNGGLETLDAVSNTISVDITTDNKIGVTSETTAATFYIVPTAGTIQAKNGKYIGKSADSNGLDADDNAMTNTFSIDEDGNAVITGNGNAVLRYNATSGQERFRYFKSSSYTNQKAIQLYKLANEVVITTYTITYNLNGAEGTISSQDVEEGHSVVLADKPAYDGHYFMGWQDESGNSYKAGKEIQVNADMTLTAQWEELGEYKRTVTAGNFGTICLANPVYEGCIENAEVYKVISFSSSSKDGLILELVDAMEAGKPYFFISKTTEIKFYYSTAQSAAASNENGLYGTINGTTVNGEGYYVLQSNELRETTGGPISLSANRAYLMKEEVPIYGSASSQTSADSPRRRVIRVQQSANTATGCEDVQGNNLQAAKVIEDGHVYIIREGKTYNAQGQLIR